MHTWKYIVVVIIFTILTYQTVFAATASYYTYESCVKEGTSGVWTASGERFDENDLTAAMWNVPFGTIVKVTNMLTNKYVYVRINDRGPSKKLVKKGRVIDLSKAAFQRISNLEKGIIPVKVEIQK